MASTLTERLRRASAEVAELKTALRQKESDYQDLQRDCRFHAIKAAEFADVIDARSQDEMVQQLKVKTVQNAELTVQVQDLRSLLETSAQRMDVLKQHKQAQHLIHPVLLQEARHVICQQHHQCT